jgi:hypothetical protein
MKTSRSFAFCHRRYRVEPGARRIIALTPIKPAPRTDGGWCHSREDCSMTD